MLLWRINLLWFIWTTRRNFFFRRRKFKRIRNGVSWALSLIRSCSVINRCFIKPCNITVYGHLFLLLPSLYLVKTIRDLSLARRYRVFGTEMGFSQTKPQEIPAHLLQGHYRSGKVYRRHWKRDQNKFLHLILYIAVFILIVIYYYLS